MEQSKHDHHYEKNQDFVYDLGFDSDDSSNDPSYSFYDESHAKFSKLSLETESKARIVKIVDVEDDLDGEEVEVVPQLNQKDTKSFELVQNMIQDKQIEKLKLEQCKLYLRKNGLRLTGNKETLIQRIKEHLEVVNGGGEKKYPAFSFVLNCKGDACTGDVVMFEQNVYEMFDIASKTGRGPPCGTRIVAGRIVKESYGAAKQQHTFTIEILWSKGEKPLSPLHPLLIKGRNLYRLKTLRQRWEDEGERQKALMEKHSRGSLARSDRESRIQKKEMRKSLKTKTVSKKVEPKSSQSQFNSTASLKSSVQPPMSNAARACQPLGPGRMFADSTQPATHTQYSDLVVNSQQPTTLPRGPFSFHHPGKVTTQPQVKRNTTMPDRYFNPASAYLDTSHVSVNNGREYNSSNSMPNVHGVTVLPSFTEFQTLPSRQPLASVNHRLPRGQCCHYAQGRCYYGETCKFSHGENYSERPSTMETATNSPSTMKGGSIRKTCNAEVKGSEDKHGD